MSEVEVSIIETLHVSDNNTNLSLQPDSTLHARHFGTLVRFKERHVN